MLDEPTLELTEYEKRSAILEGLCSHEIPSLDFYENLFFDPELVVPVICHEESKGNRVLPMSVYDAVAFSEMQPNVLLGPCSFFHDYVSKRTAKTIFGFIVDLDNLSNDNLKFLFQSGWQNKWGKRIPEPSVIVNSGHGVHLYYFLDSEVPYYKSVRSQIDQLNRMLTLRASCLEGLKPDIHWFGQTYRMVGSLNKFNLPNRAFQVHSELKRWEIDEISRLLDLDFSFRQELNKAYYEDFYIPTKKYRKSFNRSSAPKGFYTAVLKSCYEKVDIGSRYKSFMALTAIAYKCTIPIETLNDDLLQLMQHYNESSSDPMKESEVEGALRMYNTRALTVRSSVLEEWLGFEFSRRYNRHSGTDKFPRKKTDEMRAAGLKTNVEVYAKKRLDELYPDGSWRNTKGRSTYEEKIRNWKKNNPGKRITDCSKDLGINRKTVSKWWK